MVVYLGVTIVTMILAYQVDNRPGNFVYKGSRQQTMNRVCLGFIFLLLFAVSAFRVDIGNDYANYINNFHEVSVGGYVITEPGYNLLVKGIYLALGGEIYQVVFAVFAFVTIFVFIYVLYKHSDNFFLSFFLFMTLGYYFQTMNTVRYYFALAFALWSMKYIIRKEYSKFLLIILFAFLFHKSVLLVIPIYMMARIPWKKWQLGILAVVFISIPMYKDFYFDLLLKLYPSYKDTVFLEGGTSFISILRCVAVLLLGLLYYKQAILNNKRNRFYFYLNLGALGLYTCCSFIPLISRIGYYLTISQILLIPSIVEKIPDKKQQKLITWMIIIAGILYFFAFLHSIQSIDIRLIPYKTWLFES